MSKHTPGPWVASSRNSSVVGWPVVGRNGRSICNLTMPRAVSVTPAYEEESRANAHLIEAAPDMLAALKSLRDDPITFAGDKRDHSILEDYRELILPLINEAIAKAEGRS
jgi:hypothetical protein